ncbi:MAG: purine-nucleoside phosphorylase [Clostridia bacterium]|nr:purine-nucleoside phosphorylase [Clostridia bacterium]
MYQYSDYEKSAQYIRDKISSVPETAVVLGSGLGELFRGTENITIPYNEIPNFPSSTAPGHKGEMMITDKAIIMSGRFHLYEGYSVEELVYYVRTLKLLGVKTLILTNAAGGVNTDFKTGDIMMIEDHINFSGHNPLIGKNDDAFGERFTPMDDAYSKRVNDIAKSIAREQGIELKSGVYFYMTGPNFETCAEIRAIRALGGDAVGMSTVFECITARHAGMEVAGISFISNMAAGIEKFTGEDVIKSADKNKDKLFTLIDGILERISEQ